MIVPFLAAALTLAPEILTVREPILPVAWAQTLEASCGSERLPIPPSAEAPRLRRAG